MANAILNFHFDFLTTSLTSSTWPQLLSDISAGISIFFSSSPGTSRAGGTSLSILLLLYIALAISYLLISPTPLTIMFWFQRCKSEACSRSKHQEVILPIHQVKVYSKIIITAVMWTRTRNLTNYASKNPLQVALYPQSMRRASSMELVPDVPLRMKHPALPLHVSGLNEIAVVIEFPHIMWLTR